MARPRQYKTVEELEALIEEYFDSCVLDGVQVRPYTVTGLALYLNLTRQGLINYQERKGFIDTITRAKLRVEAFAEESLFTAKNSTGVAFSLKNNFDWRDKQEITHHVSLEDLVAGGE